MADRRHSIGRRWWSKWSNMSRPRHQNLCTYLLWNGLFRNGSMASFCLWTNYVCVFRFLLVSLLAYLLAYHVVFGDRQQQYVDWLHNIERVTCEKSIFTVLLFLKSFSIVPRASPWSISVTILKPRWPGIESKCFLLIAIWILGRNGLMWQILTIKLQSFLSKTQ